MGSRVRDLFTRRAPSQPLPEAPARKPAVQATALPKAPVAAVVRPGLGNVSTRDHCACGSFYGSGPEVWQELRGGHLRCFCAGCAR